MLHAWDKYGYANAQNEYWATYMKKHRHPARPLPQFRRVVLGKIQYIRLVRGSQNIIYRKLMNKFNMLMGSPIPPFFTEPLDKVFASLWVLECETECMQGTAFALDRIGVVTCAHVLGPKTVAFRHNSPQNRYPVKVIHVNEDIDLAILEIDTQTKLNSLPFIIQNDMKQLDEVTVIGFPNYRLGTLPSVTRGAVTTLRPVSGIRRILVDAPIIAGNSGGPVLNSKNQVIGVAVTGAETMAKSQSTENHGVIPISAIRHLIES